MNKKINFRGLDHSEALDNHIHQQLEKVEALLENEPTPITIDVTVEYHDTHAHNKVIAHVSTPHFKCHADHEGPDVYAEINEVIDRLYTQLKTQKEKLVDLHKQGCDDKCKERMFEQVNKKNTSEE